MTDLLVEETHGAAGDAHRTDEQLVEAAIGLLRLKPLHHVTLELVAAAAGTTTAAVTSRFPTIDDLVLAVVKAWNAQRTGPLIPIAERHGAVAFLRAIVLANAADPALMRLLTSAAAIAASDLPAAEVLQSAWIHFHAIVQRALTQDIAVGREPSTMEPARGAEQLIAIYEGLQLQSMVRPHMDVVAAFDRAVARLRDGWSHSAAPSVWEV
ncbi:TetR family transcriptional regulator [Amnibacterium kyonggiense]|uniref:TetR family transcriptional regulator n=1 Tax=Amnibacterium kyonggiense TaxID=595671 RepID=A0A4R7FSR4_9MICO|nr:TetR family transcriptional regulator [Amnibacterium kyonggiense]TDS80893.1 TetR family transcriptional regulator [Amnibacterium kyonggiense]